MNQDNQSVKRELGRKPGMPKIKEKHEFKIVGLSIDDTSFIAGFVIFILI